MHPTPWVQTERRRYPALSGHQKFDVVVIGGGITGITAACLLKAAGQRVAVLERDQLGSGETCRTTAHLTQQLDVRLPQLVKDFGDENARLAMDGGRVAIDLIERITRENGIDCGFKRVPGYLHAAWEGQVDERADLQKEAELYQALGFEAQFMEAVPVSGRPGILFPHQGRFHPLKYLDGLAQLIPGDGSAIFEHSEVTEFDDAGLRVQCGDHSVTCGHVLIATHVPLQGRSSFVPALTLQSKLYPYTSYAVEAEIAKGLVPDALYWDTSDPYYYLRTAPGDERDLIIFGGEDHKTGQEDNTGERFARLESLLHRLFPDARLTGHWSGQVVETNDGLPFIGPTADRQFIATGFSGNGMTLGVLAASMVHDAVAGRTNAWAKLFDPRRVNLKGGALDYLQENVDYPYYIVKDRMTPTEGHSIDDVQCGEGKILSIDGKTVACSRSCQGEVHTVSAYCTHMGCLVSWNGAEQTWDCACHGSRFTPDGKVIGGPAENSLDVVPSAEEHSR